MLLAEIIGGADGALRLWEAMGKPKCVWYDTTHYGAALYIPAALKPLVAHFGAD